ncbi:RT0821/Lpp0805 family surface protein [Methylophaga sp. OBS4]|uniref:RT0821/Lpp0805 family surface protein n=1 Tax=Methylophaga sp. OBS4 TaxID=2991935 RepID=UPI00225331E4|nr:RT0821/Lpp0805 family surface protein [Methylophaga sp. OBS4]MCX4186929.1 RT0821/Lpp0805 family surface protein [Methylophaga sp. OBS4]
MKKVMTTVVAATLSMALVGCTADRQTVGTAAGGVAGGVLGANVGGGTGRTAAIIGGTLLGAIIGGHIGAEMDELDRRRAADTLESYPTGRTNTWHNPDSGARYSVTPTRTYETASAPCREYEMDAYIDGQRDVIKGTACRNARGEWINQ